MNKSLHSIHSAVLQGFVLVWFWKSESPAAFLQLRGMLSPHFILPLFSAQRWELQPGFTGGLSSWAGGEQSPSPAVACYLIAVHPARNGEKLHRDFLAVFLFIFFFFFSLQDMSLQFEQGLCRQSGSLQMIIKGDVLTLNIALLLGLSACPSSAHLLLITLRQTYLGPVVQVFLSYVCHSTLFLAKMNAAKCFRVGKYI